MMGCIFGGNLQTPSLVINVWLLKKWEKQYITKHVKYVKIIFYRLNELIDDLAILKASKAQ